MFSPGTIGILGRSFRFVKGATGPAEPSSGECVFWVTCWPASPKLRAQRALSEGWRAWEVSNLSWFVDGSHPRDKAASGHVHPHVLSKRLVDERLVPDISAFGFLPESREDFRVQANGDEPTRPSAERRPPDAPHRTQLCIGRLWKVGEINLPARRHTPPFPFGSRASR